MKKRRANVLILDYVRRNGRESTSTIGNVPAWVRFGWIVVIAGLVVALILLLFPEWVFLVYPLYRR